MSVVRCSAANMPECDCGFPRGCGGPPRSDNASNNAKRLMHHEADCWFNASKHMNQDIRFG